MTEEERIFSGKLFAPAAPELAKKKEKAHRLSQDYNSLYETDSDKRNKILQELIAEIGEGTSMLGPIRFHYGCHTRIGRGCFMNFNFTVQDDCWFGANVVVCPGVTIGYGCVIGAGSVVTKDIPDRTFAAGVPAKVIRPITNADSICSCFPEMLG